jgi:ribosome-associated toxin RatA of RatAB toxin-antitoxin module
MPTVRKSVIVAAPCERLFGLVDAVERYPEFLPWCSGAEVYERDEHVTRARICIDYHGLESHIETRNEKQAPGRIALEFVDGPFQEFHGAWTFTALGAEGCRAEFALDYAFASRALEGLVGPVFGHIVETLVDRFVARAEA